MSPTSLFLASLLVVNTPRHCPLPPEHSPGIICGVRTDWASSACSIVGCETETPERGIKVLSKINNDNSDTPNYVNNYRFLIYAALGRLYFAKYIENPSERSLRTAGDFCRRARTGAKQSAIKNNQRTPIEPSLCRVIETVSSYWIARNSWDSEATPTALQDLREAIGSTDCGSHDTWSWQQISLQACELGKWLSRNGDLDSERRKVYRQTNKSLQQGLINSYYESVLEQFGACNSIDSEVVNRGFHVTSCQEDLYSDFLQLDEALRDGIVRFEGVREQNLQKAIKVCGILQTLEESSESIGEDCNILIEQAIFGALGNIEASSSPFETRVPELKRLMLAIPDRFPRARSRAETDYSELTRKGKRVVSEFLISEYEDACAKSGSERLCDESRYLRAEHDGEIRKTRGMVAGFGVATGLTFLASIGTGYAMYFPVANNARQAASAHRLEFPMSTIGEGRICADAPTNASSEYDASCSSVRNLQISSIVLLVSSFALTGGLIASVFKYKRLTRGSKARVSFSHSTTTRSWGLGVSGRF